MSDRIRWGILSTAKIAETAFIPSLRQTRRGELVAVASRDPARATSQKQPAPFVFLSSQKTIP